MGHDENAIAVGEIKFLPLKAAAQAWSDRKPGEHLTVYVTGPYAGLYASTLSHQEHTGIMSSVALQNVPIPPDAAATFAYQVDEYFQCVGAVGNPERFNRRDCLGRSLLYLDPEIAQPRLEAIREAMGRADGRAEYHYTHHWQGREWKFRGVVQYYPAMTEVVVSIYDEAEWQPLYWL